MKKRQDTILPKEDCAFIVYRYGDVDDVYVFETFVTGVQKGTVVNSFWCEEKSVEDYVDEVENCGNDMARLCEAFTDIDGVSYLYWRDEESDEDFITEIHDEDLYMLVDADADEDEDEDEEFIWDLSF